MTIATLAQVLDIAAEGRFCAAGLVVLGWEDARAFVEAAEETGLPIVLQAGPGCRRHTPTTVIGKMMRYLAERASVPVCCHIDHAYTLAECVEGLEAGFTSVMIDGSALSLEENISLTLAVVDAARRADASVEGEVGIVGYVAGRPSANTSPEEARAFARATGVDALAISIGNVHLNPERSSDFDFAALRAIEAATSAPLVIHGGSGAPLETRRKLARESRVRKLNIGTELRMAFGSALRAELARAPGSFDRIELLGATIPALRARTVETLNSLRG